MKLLFALLLSFAFVIPASVMAQEPSIPSQTAPIAQDGTGDTAAQSNTMAQPTNPKASPVGPSVEVGADQLSAVPENDPQSVNNEDTRYNGRNSKKRGAESNAYQDENSERSRQRSVYPGYDPQTLMQEYPDYFYY